jgi:membrane protein implicated in regulation of membrane protease activity
MKTAKQIWLAPVVLGIVTIVGLLSALLGDGMWDMVSVVALAIPVLVIGWYWSRPLKSPHERTN